MRDILFHGKRVDNGAWVEGFLVEDFECYGKKDEHTYIVNHKHPSDCFGRDVYIEVIPETVGQYTGLTDKIGKRIFEGDIVEHHVQGDILVNRGVVNWDGRSGRWALQLNTMNPCFYLHKPEAVEVIGNIHDNPELMEVDR